jgi:hypothetical protein
VTDDLLREVKLSILDHMLDGTDQLTFTDSSKVHGSFDMTTGVLTLIAVGGPLGGALNLQNGLVAKSEFESVLKTVKYFSTSENPKQIDELGNGSKPKDTRTVDIEIKGPLFTSVRDQMSINVVGVEDLPTITLGSDANFLVSADLPTDPNVVYSPDKLPYVNSGMNISDLDDPNAFGGLIRIANWNWKTDAFTLDIQDENGVIKPILFDVRTAANVNEAVDQISEIIKKSAGTGQYGLTYDNLMVSEQVHYVAQGEDYGDDLLPTTGTLVNAENKATLGFLQIKLGYALAVYEGDAHVYPYPVPMQAFSHSDDAVNTGVFNTLRIASNEVSVDRPVEFVITGAKKNAASLTQEQSVNMSGNEVLEHFSGSTSVMTRSVQLDFTTNNAPMVSLLPDLDLNSGDGSTITLNTIADIQDIKNSSIANESDHLQHASVTLYNVPESYEFYVAPLKASAQGKALMTQASVLEGVEANTPTSKYNSVDKSWTIEFSGDDTPENYQAMLNRLTIEDPFATGFQTTEMVIRLQDAANNGTAVAPKVTTIKTTVNLTFQYLMDDELTIPTKSEAKIAYMAVDDAMNDQAPQLVLTGVGVAHPVDAHLI